jgi:hypothetical protein
MAAVGGRVLCLQTTKLGRPTPSTSWLKVQNSYHWLQKDKQIQCGVFQKKKNSKDLNVQRAMWCCVHSISILRLTLHREKHYNFSLCNGYLLNTNTFCYIMRVRGYGFYERGEIS